ncbi:MAG: pullulanase [Actinomycetota bacterium]|nr:pullulanase [Actinomycetota bacterium]
MDYCLGDGDGSAAIWSAEVNVDTDDDGVFDAIGLDFDADGRLDDALTDLDGDGTADHLLLDLDDDGHPEAAFTDDGSGTWALGVDGRAGQIRWLGLDGVELTGGPLVDFDGDGQVDDRVLDVDRDGLADRALVGDGTYVDTDADGRWDLKLSDADGDGAADSATQLKR